MAEEKQDPAHPASEGEDPFLARWSRRKHAASRAQPASEDNAAVDSPTEQTEDDAASGAVEEASATEADLPPPESLPPDSDFSAYLTGRVSSGLRRAAMRRLFSLPEFNIRDGLDDYDEDYTQFKSLGETVTAHMRYHTERLRARREAEEARANAAAGTDAEGGSERAAEDTAEPGHRAADEADEARTGDVAGHDLDEEADEHT